jgi:glutathione peroxidase
MAWLFTFLISLGWAHSQDFYQIKETTIEGKQIKMDSYKGKVLLVVNIASQCGYTPQLEKLEGLYQKYKEKGFVVIGVPTNDFLGQTPENDQEMKEFCEKTYKVTFPLMKKNTVQGKNKRELYVYLTEKTQKPFKGEISWNFEKFLIDRNGVIIERMKPSFDPMSDELKKKIDDLLGKNANI